MYVIRQTLDDIRLLLRQKLQSLMNKLPTANVFEMAKYCGKNERARDL
jgi:hypothetical protein